MRFTFASAAALIALGAHGKDCGAGQWFIDRRSSGGSDIGACVANPPLKTEKGPCDDAWCTYWSIPANELSVWGVQCTGFCECGQNADYLDGDSSLLGIYADCDKFNVGVKCQEGFWERKQAWFGGSTWVCKPDSDRPLLSGSTLEDVPRGDGLVAPDLASSSRPGRCRPDGRYCAGKTRGAASAKCCSGYCRVEGEDGPDIKFFGHCQNPEQPQHLTKGSTDEAFTECPANRAFPYCSFVQLRDRTDLGKCGQYYSDAFGVGSERVCKAVCTGGALDPVCYCTESDQSCNPSPQGSTPLTSSSNI